jgi:predicted transcriptional regulator
MNSMILTEHEHEDSFGAAPLGATVGAAEARMARVLCRLRDKGYVKMGATGVYEVTRKGLERVEETSLLARLVAS